jgi:uncharacterized protein YukE
MAKKQFLTGMLAAALVFGVVLAGCEEMGTGGLASGSQTGAERQAAGTERNASVTSAESGENVSADEEAAADPRQLGGDTAYNQVDMLELQNQMTQYNNTVKMMSDIEEAAADLLRRLGGGGDTVNQVDMKKLEQQMTEYNKTVAMMSHALKSLGDTDQEVIRAMSTDEEAPANLQPFGNATAGAMRAMRYGEIVGQISETTQEMLDTMKQFEGTTAFADESADFQKSWNDTLQRVQGILKEILEAQNQANAAIYRNM